METTLNQIDYNAVLDDLRKKRDDLDKAISGIETMLGIATSATPAKIGGTLSALNDTVVRSDSFFGLSIVDAAKKLLEMARKPMPTTEIAEKLQEGGLHNTSANFANTVGSILTRNAGQFEGVFVRISRGVWGLRVWYPGYRFKVAKNGTDGAETLDGQSNAGLDEIA